MTDFPGLRRTANYLGALALLVQDQVRLALEEEAGRGGSAAAALLTVGTRPGGTIEALRRTLGLTHSATVRLVEGLVRDGWIGKRPGPDHRSTSLILTARGKQLHGRLLDRRREVLEQLLRKLSPAAYGQLQKALVVLLEGTAGDRQQARQTCRLCDHAVCRPCPVGSTVMDEPHGAPR